MTAPTIPTTEHQDTGPDPVTGSPARGFATRVLGRFGSGALQTVLILIALFWLVPVLGLLLSSLRSESDSADSGWWTVLTSPAQLTLHSYGELLDNPAILQSFGNTLLITIPSTVLVVVISSLAAYALAWIDFPGRDWLTIGVVGLLVLPIQIALIPIAKLYGVFGVFGSIGGVVFFHVAFGLPFAIFLLRNFFTGIPQDLLEAARMDGARELTVFRKVVLPIGLPAIASLAIFQFLWVWNDLLVALVFADADSAPITVALQTQLRQFGSNVDLLSTGSFLSMLVPLVVFFAFQRFFVQGVLAGSTK
jgi:alpha-glucoside transport system permease protein